MNGGGVAARQEPCVISLRFCFYRALDGSPLLDDYARMLEPVEAARWRSLHRSADRLLYLVTRALLRTTLSEYGDLGPADWRFAQTGHGRPMLKDGRGIASGLDFNLSHTEGLILLGVRLGGAIGVDVERLSPRATPFEILPRLLAPEEREEFDRLPVDERHGRLFQHWTLKESYVKALGTGLSHGLNTVAFRFLSPDRLSFSGSSKWRFWQFELPEQYCVAVCAESTTAAVLLQGRAVVPLCSDLPYELPSMYQTAPMIDANA